MFNILLVKSESHPPSSTYSNKMTTKAHFQPTQKLVSVKKSSDTDAFISHTHTRIHWNTHTARGTRKYSVEIYMPQPKQLKMEKKNTKQKPEQNFFKKKV